MLTMSFSMPSVFAYIPLVTGCGSVFVFTAAAGIAGIVAGSSALEKAKAKKLDKRQDKK